MPEHLTAGMHEITKGISRYNKGCYKSSLEYFFRAHELFTASDQLSGIAVSLNNIGNVYRAMGDADSAALFFDESFAIYTDIYDYQGAVQVLSNKAAALIDSGRLAKATNVLSTAEEMAQKNKLSFSPLLNTRGVLLIKKREYQPAEKILKKALADTDPQNFSEFATVNFTLGNLMLETQRYQQAVNFFNAALEKDRSSGFYKGIADDLAAIGSAYFLQKKNELAASFFKRSIKVYALIGDPEKVHSILEQLEKVAAKTGFDITVTKHFVNRWLEGKALENLCK